MYTVVVTYPSGLVHFSRPYLCEKHAQDAARRHVMSGPPGTVARVVAA